MSVGLFSSGCFGFEGAVGLCAAPSAWGRPQDQEAFSTGAGFSSRVTGRASEASHLGLEAGKGAGSDPRQKLRAVISPHFFRIWLLLPSPATCAHRTDTFS